MQQLITVILPTYNCEKYINECIESILNQTYSYFELIIIDDCSTDATVDKIKAFNDVRIQLIVKPKNSGYTNSLNYGLQIAKGKYIARMDGDDISLPTRFEKQVVFLEENSDFVLCGSIFNIIGSDKIIDLPEKNEDIKLSLLKRNCIAHPTVMIRKQILDEFSIIYNVNKEPAEDYDLWVRLISVGKLYIIQEVLLKYRIHFSQVSNTRKEHQSISATETRLNLLLIQYENVTFKEKNILRNIIAMNVLTDFKEIIIFHEIKHKLIKFNSTGFFESKGFSEFLFELEKRVVRDYFLNKSIFTPFVYLQYLKIKSRLDYKFTISQELKLFVKSFIFWRIS
jgi:glycosyltransferase involved in cell wall biosynthesis